MEKIVLLMKLTTILLLASAIQVSAATYAQTVTWSGRDVPLEKAFTAIRSQTKYTFFYRKEDLGGTHPVTVAWKDISLDKALTEILAGQPLEFDIQGRTIFIKKKILELPKIVVQEEPPALATTITVKGVVRDSAGIPLIGASIKIRGTSKGVVTDNEGVFSLEANSGDVLVISFVGYDEQQIKVRADHLSIVLHNSRSVLDEVQMIAYGKTTKRLTTGDITTVTAQEIEQQPVSNPLLALQGRVPGLVITQQNGYPNGSTQVRIQGQISLTQGSEPLVVIDGIPYNTQAVSVNGIQGSNVSALNFINAGDIESIEVLKDADATSIYGSRAAAGAILITTKQGKAGRTLLDLNAQNGWSTLIKPFHLMNTQEYLQMRHQAFINGSTTPDVTDYDINGVWDTTRYTDWAKTLLGGTAQYTDVQGSLSGGTGNTQFRISGSYNKQGLVSPGNFSRQHGSAGLNVVNTSLNQRLKIQANIQYLLDNTHLPDVDIASNITLAPDAPALYHGDGSLNWQRIPSGSGTDSLSTWDHPLARYLNVSNRTTTNNFVSSATVSYRVIPGLELRSTVGYNFQYARNLELSPLSAFAPENRPLYTRSAIYESGYTRSWQAEPQAEYHRMISQGKLDLLAGGTFYETSGFGQRFVAEGFTTDVSMSDIGAATSLSGGTTLSAVYKHDAVFGRLNYNWMDKYILDANIRRDGSSRFGSENLFHDFWSVAGAWIFSSSQLIREQLPAVSFGKLRASYGTTGNDQIGDYQFLNLYYYNSYSRPYQSAQSIVSYSLPNPYLEWEETRKLSASLDLGFLRDRILLYVNYYRNRSSNQLLNYPLPGTSGFDGVTSNFPATIQNSGWEFTLTTQNIKGKEFQWTTRLNLTVARNKLIAFPGLATSSFANQYEIGQPITAIHVYRLAGVDPQTGLYQFIAHDKTLTSNPVSVGNPDNDQTKMLDVTPDFYGGLSNTLSYKGISLSLFFQFAKQLGNPGRSYWLPGGYYQGNFPVDLLQDSWKKPGDHARFQKVSANFGLPGWVGAAVAYNQSDGAYGDASFVRIKNVSLSWSLPDSLLKRIRFQQLKLYIQGENLFTITGFKLGDPDAQGLQVMPPLRTVTCGVQLTL